MPNRDDKFDRGAALPATCDTGVSLMKLLVSTHSVKVLDDALFQEHRTIQGIYAAVFLVSNGDVEKFVMVI